MPVTTIEGIVENGQIRLPAHVRLPEKAKVYIVIPDVEVLPRVQVASPRLAHPEQAIDFEKTIIENDETWTDNYPVHGGQAQRNEWA